MLDTFRKTFYLVGRDNPGRWVALVCGAVLASVIEMTGAVLIYLLLALVVDPGGQLAVPLLGDLQRLAGTDENTSFLLWSALALGIFFILRAGYQILYAYVRHRLAMNAGARLSAKLARGYLHMPYAFHLRRSTAELVRNAQQTVEQLAGQAFLQVITVIAESLVVLGLVTVMLAIAPVATGVAVLLIGAAALLLLTVVQPKLRELGKEAQLRRRSTLSALQQSLYGIRDIKILGVEDHFADEYQRNYDRLARSNYLRGMILETPRLTIETALIVFILLLFSVSIASGTATQELLSILGLFAYAGLRLQPSLQKLVAALNSVRYSSQAVDDVYADLHLVGEASAKTASRNPLPLRQRLRFEDVSFTYDGSDHPTLREVTLTIEAGQVVGIHGPTGGGKTTFVDLLTGLLEPTAGRITVDGQDLHEHRDAWFASIGVVPQMIFLIDDTIRNNIALGIPEADIDDAAIDRAVEIAQLRDVVADLPRGLETVVGERGVRLSGGQRQRVAIARALYRDPNVLILDEGTSALDDQTETQVLTALEQAQVGRTVLMVAHRLGTLQSSDVSYRIDSGRVQTSRAEPEKPNDPRP